MAKYDPLYHYLRRKPVSTIELSFRDVERVIGAMLPNSAARPQWWANETDPDSSHVQTRAWRDAGFKAYLIASKDRVRFERTPR